jgi:hypothetical protein
MNGFLQPLENTFVYDPNDTQARTKFDQILQDETILFVVLGKDPIAVKALIEGDDQAFQSPFGVKRTVVWLPDHLVEKTRCMAILQTLSSFDPITYEKVTAFSVKPVSDKAADVLFPEEMPDEITTLLRIKRAYARAGQDLRIDI